MPPLLSLWNDQTRRHRSEREGTPRDHKYMCLN